jgi:dUTP pyrophosphatase
MIIGIPPINKTINIFSFNLFFIIKMAKKNNNIKVLVKKMHPDSKLPTYSKPGDAAMDVYAHSVKSAENNKDPYMEYDTGIAVKIPEGYVGLIFPRSSISKTPYMLANGVGVVDSGYTGSIKLRYKLDATLIEHGSLGNVEVEYYDIGDRIGQLMILPFPTVELEEVKELPSTERGDGGFGSSGK